MHHFLARLTLLFSFIAITVFGSVSCYYVDIAMMSVVVADMNFSDSDSDSEDEPLDDDFNGCLKNASWCKQFPAVTQLQEPPILLPDIFICFWLPPKLV